MTGLQTRSKLIQYLTTAVMQSQCFPLPMLGLIMYTVIINGIMYRVKQIV